MSILIKSAQVVADIVGLVSALAGKQDKNSVVSTNTTAVNDGIYTVVNNTTFTDPSPVEGKGYIVLLRNGTATIGGTAYTEIGNEIKRVFYSGAWANYVSPITSNIRTVNGLSLMGSGNVGWSIYNYVVGRTYTSNLNAPATGTFAMVANTLRAVPFVIGRAITIDELSFVCSTLITSSNTIAGIYNTNASGLPGTPVVTTDVQSTATTGIKTTGTLGSPVTLQPGLYWAVFHSSANPTLQAGNSNSLVGALGVTASGTTVTVNGALSKAVTYTGTLPTDPFVEGDRVTATSNAPFLLYRISALP